jgi:hypothetical protein
MTATLTQYIDAAGLVETPWTGRTYGRHSDTRHLDDITVPVWLLLKRESRTGTPKSHRKAAA